MPDNVYRLPSPHVCMALARRAVVAIHHRRSRAQKSARRKSLWTRPISRSPTPAWLGSWTGEPGLVHHLAHCMQAVRPPNLGRFHAAPSILAVPDHVHDWHHATSAVGNSAVRYRCRLITLGRRSGCRRCHVGHRGERKGSKCHPDQQSRLHESPSFWIAPPPSGSSSAIRMPLSNRCRLGLATGYRGPQEARWYFIWRW